MRRIKWSFDRDTLPTYDGMTDDTTWNGFDNVYIPAADWPQVRDSIIASDADFYAVETEALAELMELRAGDDGMVSLANGFACIIVG